ncbi:MAG: NUDIX hydrolase [Clostridia bacterium]|nr:NUDIX hydrolase [Clostridia bacterium]
MNLHEKKLKSKTVYDGKILTLEVDEVELPDGKKSYRECVRHSGGAAVLLIKDNKILLVKQYRYLYGKPIYEIPAGKLNKGEDPKIAAARELEEETGYRAELSHLLDIYPSVGYTDEIIHIYFAQSYEVVGQKLDEGEFLNYYFIDIETVLKMIESGEINDAKTIVAVYKYLLNK